MPMPKAMVAGNTISSISSGKSTLGLTIPNAILARNLGSSLALQVVNTPSISAGSGGVGAISGRETCVWVSHHISSDVDVGIHAVVVHHRSSIQLHPLSHWSHGGPTKDGASIWSFMSEISGDTTMVMPLSPGPRILAGLSISANDLITYIRTSSHQIHRRQIRRVTQENPPYPSQPCHQGDTVHSLRHG
ncbi:hypothetical protein V8E54_008521 [Elaphomyces granulatus]